MNNFFKGLLIAGAAPTVLNFVPVVGSALAGDDLDTAILLWLGWFLAPAAFLVTLIAGLASRTFYTTGGRAGVLTGLGLAVVTMGTTCFAMWNG